jgi:hypothetical protein
MMTSAKALCIGCTTAVLLGSVSAQAQEACSTYVVVQGDNLRSIARKAYGDPDLYRVIFDANRELIGSKADLILIGASLTLPCDPAKPESTAVVAASDAGADPAPTEVIDPAAVGLETEVVDPASVPLSTEVIDPAKEPLVIVPELPVVEGSGEGTVAAVEPAAEEPVVEVTPTEEEPAAEVAIAAEEPAVVEEAATEAAPAEEAATEVTEATPAEEAATEVTEAAPAEEAAPVEPAAVEEAPAEEAVAEVEVTPTPEPAAEEPAPVEVAAEPAAASADPIVVEGDGPIKILTGNGYEPFADEMLPGGGMFTQIVEMAVFRADPDQPYSLTFVNDWQAHVDALLPSGAYDLSFPWIRPNCEAPESLSAGDLARCNDFAFSAPYYEVVDGFFASADSELLQSTEYTDFVGKRICRPEAYTTGVLESHGLGSDKVTMSRPLEASDCFEALAEGEVDLVSLDTAVGDAILKDMKLTDKFRQNPSLTTVSTLHVIAYKANPRAVAMLKMLDEGAMEMNQSGEWWDIVSSALDKQ